MTIHVVGNACIDTTLSVDRFPAPGETMAATGSRAGIGGKGVNQAVAAARTGAAVALHAAVGRDAAAARIRQVLIGEGLLLHLREDDGLTDRSIILVRPDGENVIVSDTACARAFDPGASPDLAEAVTAGDIVLLQGNLAVDTTMACLRLARRRSAGTMFNPSPWDAGRAFDWPLVDCLVANAGEIQMLTGAANPESGAGILRARGVASVAATLGGRGVLFVDDAGACPIAAPAVVAVDTAGAGDVLCGVAIGLIAQGFHPQIAFARAAAAAALSVTRPGVLESFPSAAEIRALAPGRPP